MDFSEVNDEVHSFCVLRHDIEFSIDRALEMARIEHEDLNVHSTYTVQLRNNTYNALSQKNIEAIQEIESMGHYIGLHQHPPMMEDEVLVDYILIDIHFLFLILFLLYHTYYFFLSGKVDNSESIYESIILDT